jgi:hypothetical protein
MQIDTPLDDLVKKARRRQSQSKRGRKGGATGGRAGTSKGVGPTRNARGEVAAQAARAAKKGGRGSAAGVDPSKFPAQTGQGKIVISNLPEDVTEAQLRVGCACRNVGPSFSEFSSAFSLAGPLQYDYRQGPLGLSRLQRPRQVYGRQQRHVQQILRRPASVFEVQRTSH